MPVFYSFFDLLSEVGIFLLRRRNLRRILWLKFLRLEASEHFVSKEVGV